METLLAYHGKKEIKSKYLGRVKAHEKADDVCWNWTKGINNHGYGNMWIEGKTRAAHRVSYEIYKGEIPKGMVILHSCDNKRCINPNHLSVGTFKENTHDALRKGRMAFGERQGNSILKNRDVVVIKQRLANKERIVDIARDYSVDETTIGKIKSGANWKNI